MNYLALSSHKKIIFHCGNSFYFIYLNEIKNYVKGIRHHDFHDFLLFNIWATLDFAVFFAKLTD